MEAGLEAATSRVANPSFVHSMSASDAWKHCLTEDRERAWKMYLEHLESQSEVGFPWRLPCVVMVI